MLKRLVLLISVLLICPLCFAGQPVNTTVSPVQNNYISSKYPPEMLNHFSKEYLDLYFSLPPEQRTDDAINRFGQYEISHNGPAFNSVYKPTSTIYPLVPKWQQDLADYYDTLPTE